MPAFLPHAQHRAAAPSTHHTTPPPSLPAACALPYARRCCCCWTRLQHWRALLTAAFASYHCPAVIANTALTDTCRLVTRLTPAAVRATLACFSVTPRLYCFLLRAFAAYSTSAHPSIGVPSCLVYLHAVPTLHVLPVSHGDAPAERLASWARNPSATARYHCFYHVCCRACAAASIAVALILFVTRAIFLQTYCLLWFVAGAPPRAVSLPA